jgi:hypothetical protein
MWKELTHHWRAVELLAVNVLAHWGAIQILYGAMRYEYAKCGILHKNEIKLIRLERDAFPRHLAWISKARLPMVPYN